MCDDIGVICLNRFAEVAATRYPVHVPAILHLFAAVGRPQVSRSPKGGRVKLLGDPRAPSISSRLSVHARCPLPVPPWEPELRKIGDNHSWPAIWSRTAIQQGGE